MRNAQLAKPRGNGGAYVVTCTDIWNRINSAFSDAQGSRFCAFAYGVYQGAGGKRKLDYQEGVARSQAMEVTIPNETYRQLGILLGLLYRGRLEHWPQSRVKHEVELQFLQRRCDFKASITNRGFEGNLLMVEAVVVHRGGGSGVVRYLVEPWDFSLQNALRSVHISPQAVIEAGLEAAFVSQGVRQKEASALLGVFLALIEAHG